MPDDGRSPQRPIPSTPAKRKVAPNGVLAMLIFIAVELMFFAGLIAAFTIVKSTTLPGAWPPAGQPRLPVEATAINTAALIASGVCMWLAARVFWRNHAAPPSAGRRFIADPARAAHLDRRYAAFLDAVSRARGRRVA